MSTSAIATYCATGQVSRSDIATMISVFVDFTAGVTLSSWNRWHARALQQCCDVQRHLRTSEIRLWQVLPFPARCKLEYCKEVLTRQTGAHEVKAATVGFG